MVRKPPSLLGKALWIATFSSTVPSSLRHTEKLLILYKRIRTNFFVPFIWKILALWALWTTNNKNSFKNDRTESLKLKVKIELNLKLNYIYTIVLYKMVIRKCIYISHIHYYKNATRRDILRGFSVTCSEILMLKNTLNN